jgi:general secretion pathway protein D
MHKLQYTAALLSAAAALTGFAQKEQPRIVFEPLPLSNDLSFPRPDAALDKRPDVSRIEVLIEGPVNIVDQASISEADIAALIPDQTVAATLPPQPLGQFAEIMLGQVLNVPYILGPGVAQRRDIISMSGPKDMSSRQFFRLAEKALNQYGLVLTQQSGAIVVSEGSVRKTVSSPNNVVHVAALKDVSAVPAAGVVSDVIDGGSVTVETVADVNGIILSGEAGNVSDARQLLSGIDRPEFVGSRVARITPVLWSADVLAEKLRELLASEGFAIGTSGSGGTNLVHLEKPDCLLLFSDDARLFNRVMYWVNQLDSLDGAGGDHAGYFVYKARNTTASELGNLVSRTNSGGEETSIQPADGNMDDGSQSTSGPRKGRPALGLPGTAGGDTSSASGKIVIDNAGNRILFRGTRREYAQLYRLLNELDVPAKQVLVEITIAEVALTDETRFGMEWFLDRQLSNGSIQGTTTGGLSRELGGLGVTFARGFSQTSVTAALSAIATNQNLNILSTPRLLARSGGEAQILIGNDIPIISSQRAGGVQSGGDTDILQTVQYRQTGVILNIRPVVLSNDRIDIEIFQEVSSQQPNVTSSIGSPVISNRSVTTRLSLREGMTAVLGGMIQDSTSVGQRGVPLLKDIPLLGRAFRVDSATKRKTELLILVTPRVIKEDRDMQNITAAFSGSMNNMMNGRGQKTFTLIPWLPGQAMPEHRHFRFAKENSKE